MISAATAPRRRSPTLPAARSSPSPSISRNRPALPSSPSTGRRGPPRSSQRSSQQTRTSCCSRFNWCPRPISSTTSSTRQAATATPPSDPPCLRYPSSSPREIRLKAALCSTSSLWNPQASCPWARGRSLWLSSTKGTGKNSRRLRSTSTCSFQGPTSGRSSSVTVYVVAMATSSNCPGAAGGQLIGCCPSAAASWSG
jgi:hypothetical protein